MKKKETLADLDFVPRKKRRNNKSFFITLAICVFFLVLAVVILVLKENSNPVASGFNQNNQNMIYKLTEDDLLLENAIIN